MTRPEPQVPAPQANVEGAPEPDDEPNPVHIGAGGGEEGTKKRTDKIDLRNVKSETFSGVVPLGAYDSGVRDWWEQFADQVEDAQFLSELSQSDGRLDDYKRRKLTDGSHAPRGDAKGKPAEASFKSPRPHGKPSRAKSNVAIVERKRKPTKAPRRGGVVCFICGEEGHTAKYHRQHLSEDKTETEDSRAQSNVAKTEDAVGDSSDDSDEDSA
eukprot:jgi/Phyca11/14078/fgenesh1_pg.PHYCAscaffold_5_\